MCLEGEERGKEGRVEEVVKGRGICSSLFTISWKVVRETI